jgi:predicted nucleotidyltransferase
MTAATEHLRELAGRIVEEARARVTLRGAMLVGSAGRGDADFYSDVDLLLYVDELPSQELVDELRSALGGVDPISRSVPADGFLSEEFEVESVRAEVSFVTVRRVEARLDELLEHLEDADPSLQKVLAGMLEGEVVFGEALLERWRDRVGEYPDERRRAMIERHWNFFPLWYFAEPIALRDAELWRLDILLEGAFNLLAVLSALNRLYFARFELKRTRALVVRMEVAPPRLVDRLESLFGLEPDAAAAELGRLVEETRDLVAAEFPDLELPLRFQPGSRQPKWSV